MFLKEPQPGRVKTRLAQTLGDRAASDVARACAELLCARLSDYRDEATVCVHPPEAVARLHAWLGSAWTAQPQHGATLGERLDRAIGDARRDGAQHVVVIGTDSPWLAAADIEQAFEALASSDVVLGPTEDGGYYLIGVRGHWPALFEDIDWSTDRVLQQTLARAERLGLSVQLLRSGYDVDRYEDLQRFLADAAAADAAPALQALMVFKESRRDR